MKVGKFKFTKKDKKYFFRIISGICSDLTAAWLTVILIAPGFSGLSFGEILLSLTRNLLFAIVFMWLAFRFEKAADKL